MADGGLDRANDSAPASSAAISVVISVVISVLIESVAQARACGACDVCGVRAWRAHADSQEVVIRWYPIRLVSGAETIFEAST